MKKIFSALLIAALILSLCACGGPDRRDDAGTGAPEAVTLETAAPDQPAQTYISQPLPLPAGMTDIAAVAVSGETIYLCAGDSTLYALDAQGTVQTSFRLAVDDGTVVSMAAAGDGTVWLMTMPPSGPSAPAGALCRFDPDKGQVLDSFQLPAAGAVLTDLCADGARQRLYAADGADLLVLDDGGNELFRLPGAAHDLAVAADGTVAALEQQVDAVELLVLDAAGKKWERALTFDTQDVALFSGGGKYDLLAAVDGTLCALDLKGRALTPLVELALTNAVMLDDVFALPGGRFLLSDSYGPTLYLAQPGTDGGPVAITAAVFSPGMLNQAVVAFNNSQDDYQVVLRDYSVYNDVSKGFYDTGGLEQLGLDIASGNAPDILALDMLPVYQYINDGLLADLLPYIDADPDLGRDSLDQALLAALERDGALYELAAVAQMPAILTAPGVLDGQTDVTWRGVLDALGESAFAGEGSGGLLTQAVCGDGSPFVDWQSGACDFENDEFLALLALARGAEQPEQPDAPRSILLRSVPGGAGLIQPCQELGLTSGVPVLSGLPGRDGPRYLLSPVIDLGICAQSSHPDGAWAFLRTLLTEPSSMWMGRFLAQGAQTDPAAFAVLSEGVPQDWLTQLDGAADGAFAAANGVYHQDLAIAAILREEAAPYFAGQATAEQTAAAIQSRVSLYLAEHS